MIKFRTMGSGPWYEATDEDVQKVVKTAMIKRTRELPRRLQYLEIDMSFDNAPQVVGTVKNFVTDQTMSFEIDVESRKDDKGRVWMLEWSVEYLVDKLIDLIKNSGSAKQDKTHGFYCNNVFGIR